MAENPQAVKVVTVSPLPVSAIQALYHAATGKTENLRKSLTANVLVKKDDLDQLRLKLHQQLEHFSLITGPTETINLSFKNNESQQFSSWERFDFYDSGKTEIINDVTLKFEFLIKLPSIESPQRYVISVNVDSKLPMVSDDDFEDGEGGLWWLEKYPNLNVSIDFIDYLCAKNFLQIIEEWFNSLEEIPNSRWILAIRRSSDGIRDIFNSLGNIGIAIFVVIYASMTGLDKLTPVKMAYFLALSIIIYTISTLFFKRIGRSMIVSIGRSIKPSSIILTIGDEREFKKIEARSIPKTALHILASSVAIFLNIVASYVYAWLTT